MAFGKGLAPLAGEVKQGGERADFPEEAAAENRKIAEGDVEPVLAVDTTGDVFDAHQEAVLDRVHVQAGGQVAPHGGGYAADMEGAGFGDIEATPAEQLGAPGDVGIFAVGEEGRVKEFAVDGNVVNHGAAVEGGGAGSAKDILTGVVAPVVGFVPAAIEVAEGTGHNDTGGIEQRLGKRFEAGTNGEELAAGGADAGVARGGFHQPG